MRFRLMVAVALRKARRAAPLSVARLTVSECSSSRHYVGLSNRLMSCRDWRLVRGISCRRWWGGSTSSTGCGWGNGRLGGCVSDAIRRFWADAEVLDRVRRSSSRVVRLCVHWNSGSTATLPVSTVSIPVPVLRYPLQALGVREDSGGSSSRGWRRGARGVGARLRQTAQNRTIETVDTAPSTTHIRIRRKRRRRSEAPSSRAAAR